MINYISINEAAKVLNINVITFQKRLDYHNYLTNGGRIVEKDFQDILLQKSKTINLDTVIQMQYKKIYGKEINYKYLKKVLVYISGFNYWGCTYFERPIYQLNPFKKNDIYIYTNDIDIIQNNLYEYLYMHSASYNDKLKYLLNQTRLTEFVGTNKRLQLFAEIYFDDNSSAVVEVINYFRFKLDKDIELYLDDEIEKLLEDASNNLSKLGKSMLIKFIERTGFCDELSGFTYKKHHDEVVSENESQEKRTNDTPYDTTTYYKLAFMIVNEKYWEQNQMIAKACEHERLAKVWLYHFMHLTCAWRSNDIRNKIPRPVLDDLPSITLEKIRSRAYTQSYYIQVAELVFNKFIYSRLNKPSKKKERTQFDELRLTIPESYKPLFGMLTLMCEAHNQNRNFKGSLCEIKNFDKDDGRRLFGEDYTKVLEGKAFSNRRANKNYMGSISDKAKDYGVDGYIMAAYIRSHQGGLGKIPEVTSRYLEAKMNGYTPDEIVKCLMERGVCSFVPYLLCDVLFKNEFPQLSINEQTEFMKENVLSPLSIEKILALDDVHLMKSRLLINELVRKTEIASIHELARKVLESILTDNCIGKNEGEYCLAKACSLGCINIQRESCIGCGYEVLVKSFLINLSQKIYRVEESYKNGVSEGEKAKWYSLLVKKLYPLTQEILVVLRTVYGVETPEYYEIFKRSGIYGFIDSN